MTDLTWAEPELPNMGGHTPDHRPNAYWEEDQLIVRASALGGCEKALIASAMGLEGDAPPAKLVGKWDESAALEPEMIRLAMEWVTETYGTTARLADPDVKTDRAQLHQGRLSSMGGQWGFTVEVAPNVNIRGHLDGVGLPYVWLKQKKRPAPFGIEVKALGDAYWEKFIDLRQDPLFDQYWSQVMLYKWVTQMPFVYGVGHKVDGKIVEAKFDLVQVQGDVGPLIAKAMRIKRLAEKGELPDCDEKMWPCPFWWMHEKQAEDIETVEDAELEQLLETYRDTMEDIGKWKNIAAGMKEEIIRLAGRGKKNVGKYKLNVFSSEYPEKTVVRKAYSTTTVKIEEQTNEDSH